MSDDRAKPLPKGDPLLNATRLCDCADVMLKDGFRVGWHVDLIGLGFTPGDIERSRLFLHRLGLVPGLKGGTER